MSTREVTMYTAICDGCGADAGEGCDTIAWEAADSAVEVALDSGWYRADDGRLLCDKCYFDEIYPDV